MITHQIKPIGLMNNGRPLMNNGRIFVKRVVPPRSSWIYLL